jgi:type VI secretion system FHA domain protein
MAAAPPQAAAPADGALLAAFLAGAGVPGARIEDPAATMGALGAAFRAMVSGLRAVLIARAAIKGEFRIEQTMIRARGNNPLKFSADDDDALAALLGTGRRTNMEPAEAVAEALRDMKLHELASVAAMQTAVREMLAQLSPEAIQAQAGSGGLLPVQRKARAFEAYEASHAALVRALADDFDSAFGKAFARAYEEALREAAAKPEDP